MSNTTFGEVSIQNFFSHFKIGDLFEVMTFWTAPPFFANEEYEHFRSRGKTERCDKGDIIVIVKQSIFGNYRTCYCIYYDITRGFYSTIASDSLISVDVINGYNSYLKKLD